MSAKKDAKRLKLELNKMRGKLAEDVYETFRPAQGYEIKRKPRGSDYEERRVNPLTGRRGPRTLVEIKSTRTAPMSKLQKKTKKKTKRYKKMVMFD